MLKFNKHNVADTVTKAKARVWYDLDNHISERPCVWVHAKDFQSGRTLAALMADAFKDDTERNADFFDMGKVVLFEGHPMYEAARATAGAR